MDRVCALIRQGFALRGIAERDGMPTLDTLGKWLEESRAFRARYELARKMQREIFADDVLALARAVAGPDVAADEIPGLKLRIEALKWRVGGLPKNDGDSHRPGFELDDEAVERLQRAAERIRKRHAATDGAVDGAQSDGAPSEEAGAQPADAPPDDAPENRFAASPWDDDAASDHDPWGDER